MKTLVLISNLLLANPGKVRELLERQDLDNLPEPPRRALLMARRIVALNLPEMVDDDLRRLAREDTAFGKLAEGTPIEELRLASSLAECRRRTDPDHGVGVVLLPVLGKDETIAILRAAIERRDAQQTTAHDSLPGCRASSSSGIGPKTRAPGRNSEAEPPRLLQVPPSK